MIKTDIIVVGGGASGFMAAITAKREDSRLRVSILERQERVLRKVYASGNGRCNFTNAYADISAYTRNSSFAQNALNIFTPANAMSFFEGLGVFPRVDAEGRVYPNSNQSASVVDVLRLEAERLGIEIVTSCDVVSLKKRNGLFIVSCKDGRVFDVGRVIVAGGGKAGTDLGGTSSGYDLLCSVGHTLERIEPSLVQMKTDKNALHGLAGVSFRCEVSAYKNGKLLRTEEGECLLTDYGVSGIAVMNLSAFCAHSYPVLLRINLLSGLSVDASDLLCNRKRQLTHLSAENFLNGLVNKKLGMAICKMSGIEKLSLPVSEISQKQIDNIVKNLTALELTALSSNGFRTAQSTSGGVSCREFDDRTMESRIVRGLYVCGEVLGVDAICGGYHLQWAWSSGYVAGKNCAFKKGKNE